MKKSDILINRWFQLAEKLLNNQNVEVCFDVCDEIELMLEEKEDLSEDEKKVFKQRVKKIRLELNTYMAKKVRENIHKNNKTV